MVTELYQGACSAELRPCRRVKFLLCQATTLLVLLLSMACSAASSASQLMPAADLILLSKSTRQGQDVKLICSSEQGEPPMRFDWSRDGVPLSSRAPVSLVAIDAGSSALLIKQASALDAGNYSCLVANQHGQSRAFYAIQIEGETVGCLANAADRVSTEIHWRGCT